MYTTVVVDAQFIEERGKRSDTRGVRHHRRGGWDDEGGLETWEKGGSQTAYSFGSSGRVLTAKPSLR